MNRVRFVEPARLEILAEVGYYHRIEAVLGAKFLEAVEDATSRALAYPLAGSLAQHRTRRVFLRDQEDGSWLGNLEEFPDDWTQGDTLSDLVEHLKDLYLHLSGGHISGARKVGELVVP